jgi:uncharacterized repeat protein (TIGR03803 family)
MVFRLAPKASGYTESILSNLQGSNGSEPVALIANGDSFLGEALSGGPFSGGTVFAVNPVGSGGYLANAVHDFGIAPSDGTSPIGGLTPDGTGSFYGATTRGGGNDYGTVFKLSPPASGASRGYVETVLFYFGENGPLAVPTSAIAKGTQGKLYGVTAYSQAYKCPSSDCGAIYALVPTVSGFTEHVIHIFDLRYGDGIEPAGNLLEEHGLYFGATVYGGIGYGTVYDFDGGHRYRILCDFNNSDGAYPTGSLVADSAGSLYGTTGGGGTYGDGTVFRLTPLNGEYVESVLCMARPPTAAPEPRGPAASVRSSSSRPERLLRGPPVRLQESRRASACTTPFDHDVSFLSLVMRANIETAPDC